jgi:hypothetical protein
MRGLGGRTHWGSARLEGRRPLILLACTLAAFAVFACFYEIGRATRSTHVSPQPSYAPHPHPGEAVRAGIPNTLVAPSPIPAPVPLKAARGTVRSNTLPAGRPSLASGAASSTATKPEVSSASPSRPASAPPAPPARAPAPSTTVSRPSHEPAAASHPTASHPTGSQPAGGHGSFDTSG